MATHKVDDFAGAATFNENLVNAAARIIDTSVTLTNSPNGWNGGTLTVSGLLAEDTVSVANIGTAAGQIGLSGANVTYGGVTIGTLAGGAGGTLTITFNGSATAAAIEALIEALTYANSSDTPTATRTLTLDLTDSAGDSLTATFGQLTGASHPFGSVLDIGGDAAPVFVDLDNDGDMDMVTGEYNGFFFYYRNDGTASSPSFTQVTGGASPLEGPSMGGARISNPEFADLDNDGDLDMVSGGAWGTFAYWENIGTASAAWYVQRSGVFNPFESLSQPNDSKLAFGDIDGDGDLDFFAGQNDGIMKLYLNTGTVSSPTFVAQSGAADPFDGVDIGNHPHMILVDWDNDGDLDMVVGEYQGGIKYFENTGTANAAAFTERTGAANPWNGIDVGLSASPALVDIDNDGDLDIFIGNEAGEIRYFQNGGGAPTVLITVNAQGEGPTLLADTLAGTPGADTIKALAGADEVHGGGGADSLDGGADADILYGDAGNDILAGGTGADTLYGGLGDDTYFVTDAGDVVDETGGDGTDTVRASVTYTLPTGVENLTMLYQAAIDGAGNSLANILTGNSAANTLSGLGGDDTLYGGSGADTLNGGDGQDTLYGDAGNDSLNGGADGDWLHGGVGNDVLDGGTGDDFLYGGAGADTYYVDSADDTVVEAAGGGTDTVISSASHSLGSEVENLTLAGSGDLAAGGNALANVITGNTGDNYISAGAGNDTILAGDGDDWIIGGAGSDTLTGGAGGDTFVFGSADIGIKVETDRILDFSTSQGDVIDLSGIDANSILGGEQDFVWATRFTRTAGQAVMTYANGVTTVALDVNGDGKADFKIALSGDHTATRDNLYTGAGDTDGGWVL